MRSEGVDLAMGSPTNLAKLAAFLVLPATLTACVGGNMKPSYAKSDVQPVEIQRIDADRVVMRFHVPPESMHFASGVNYEITGDVLRVAIDRCEVQGTCSTMVRRATPLPESRIGEVVIPFSGRKVTVVYSDREDNLDL